MKLLFRDFLIVFHLLSRQLKIRTIELFFVMVVASLMELAVIMSLATMGVAVTASAGLRDGFFYWHLFHYLPHLGIWAQDNRNFLLLTGLFVIISSLLKNCSLAYSSFRTSILGEDISIDIGSEILERYLYRDYAWHLTEESHTMLQRMLWRGNLSAMLITLLSMYAAFITLAVLFFSLMAAEPLLTTFTVITTAICGAIVYVSLQKMVDTNANIATKANEQETKALLCATKGVRDVLMYNRQKQFLASVVDAARGGKIARIHSGMAPAIPSWILETFGFSIVVSCIAYLAWIEEASLARITSALALLTLTAWRVLPYCNRIVSQQVVVRSLRPITHQVIELLVSLRKTPLMVPPALDQHFKFSHALELKQVGFRYQPNAPESISNINLTIPCGTKIGLIGRSGAGKSTLAAVIAGLLPPTSGTISIDGVEADRTKLHSFTARIGYVPQAPFLFAGSLAENIAFSHWGEKVDEARVREVCAMAAIDFIDTHPHHIHQPIGENGGGLSGGQAQRVAIARALYNNPDIIIFDEATSALDAHNENIIIRTLYNLPKNITAIIIAHRLTTVEHCDQVVLMDAGKIVRISDPAEVLAAYTSEMSQAFELHSGM